MEVTFSKLLAENGLKLSDFKIYNLDPQAGAAAVAAGRVDGFFTLSDAYSLVDKQVGKIIWSTKTAPDDWKMRAELGVRRFRAALPRPHAARRDRLRACRALDLAAAEPRRVREDPERVRPAGKHRAPRIRG